MQRKKTVLLSTAFVFNYRPKHNNFIQIRVILDIVSQTNYIASEIASKCRLKKEKINIPVSVLKEIIQCDIENLCHFS